MSLLFEDVHTSLLTAITLAGRTLGVKKKKKQKQKQPNIHQYTSQGTQLIASRSRPTTTHTYMSLSGGRGRLRTSFLGRENMRMNEHTTKNKYTLCLSKTFPGVDGHDREFQG
jgi:hypothetical protein